MSLFSKLFGGRSHNDNIQQEPKREDPIEYEGYKIIAAPIPEGKQWRMAGYIIKSTEDGELERHFIRADIYYSRDEAVEYTVMKGKQVIDQMGDRIFADGAPTGRA